MNATTAAGCCSRFLEGACARGCEPDAGGLGPRSDGDNHRIDEDLQRVRRQPEFWIGSTTTDGMHRLLWELVEAPVLDNTPAPESVGVTLHRDGAVTIDDDGRGIPVDPLPDSGLPAVTVVLTAPPRWWTTAAPPPGDSSRAVQGFGVAVVNALSARLVVDVRHWGRLYRQAFERGEPLSALQDLGECGQETGTTLVFLPDPEIFGDGVWSRTEVVQGLSSRAAMRPGIRIRFVDERGEGWAEEFYCQPEPV